MVDSLSLNSRLREDYPLLFSNMIVSKLVYQSHKLPECVYAWSIMENLQSTDVY